MFLHQKIYISPSSQSCSILQRISLPTVEMAIGFGMRDTRTLIHNVFTPKAYSLRPRTF